MQLYKACEGLANICSFKSDFALASLKIRILPKGIFQHRGGALDEHRCTTCGCTLQVTKQRSGTFRPFIGACTKRIDALGNRLPVACIGCGSDSVEERLGVTRENRDDFVLRLRHNLDAVGTTLAVSHLCHEVPSFYIAWIGIRSLAVEGKGIAELAIFLRQQAGEHRQAFTCAAKLICLLDRGFGFRCPVCAEEVQAKVCPRCRLSRCQLG